MTKMIKMSLIAAVAVTSMTSVASAQPLEEAIKGVDVSGMLRYRYDDRQVDVKADNAGAGADKVSNQWNNYRLDLNVKSKVNDTVTANVTVGVAGNNGSGANLAENTEGSAALNVRNANFSAGIAGATVIAGKQSIPGPFVDNTVDDTSRGTGVVALVPAGPVTIAAGHFVTHDVQVPTGAQTLGNYLNSSESLTGTPATDTKTNGYLVSKNATELALLGSAAGVSFDVWYANVADTLNAFSYHAAGSVAGINVDARYSTLDMTDAYDGIVGAGHGIDGKSSLLKVVASTKVGAATVRAGLATTGKENGNTYNRISISNDNDSATDFKLWQASAGALADATAFLIGAGMEVMPSVSVTADYLTVAAKDGSGVGAQDLDAAELLLGATYTMSKNFSVHARMSWMEVDLADPTENDVDSTRGRLQLQYTF
jgi:predicted porin